MKLWRKGTWASATAILILSLATPVAAADGTISGTVTSIEESALPGVTVRALQIASGKETQVDTDADGAYELTGLAAGGYRLTVSLSGFADVGRSVELADGEELTADFTLKLGSLEEMITITAARGERALAEIPQSVTVVTASELEDRRPRSVQEAYERVPNMHSIEANPSRSRPTFRGFSSSRLLLLLDSERINNARIDANATGLSPGMIDVTQLESIEVVGGAGSSLYGTDAHGGTINLITKSPGRPSDGARFDVFLEGVYSDNGDFDREYAQADYGTDRWGFRASISRFDQTDYEAGGEAITRAEVLALGEFSNQLAGNANTYTIWELPSGGEVRNSQADGINGRADLWFYPSDTHNFRFTYLLSEHDDLGAAFNQQPFNNVLRFNEFRDFDKLTLRYEALDLKSWLPRLAVRLYTQEFRRPQNDISFTVDVGSSYAPGPSGFVFTGDVSTFNSGGSNSQTLNEVKSSGGEVQLNFAPWQGAVLISGLQLVRDESEDTFNRSLFTGNNPASVTTTIAGATTPDSTYENLGWFSQLEWQAADWLRFTAGLRYDEWESETAPTDGYPLPGGSELGFLGVALNQLPSTLTNFGFNLDGVGAFVDSVAQGQSFSTSNDVWTSNLGLTFTLPNGINPYIRWGESYREPEVTVRYLVRNFGSPFFGVQSLPNPFLEPEEGESLDLGVKIDQGSWRASVGYFKNEIDNFIDGIVTPTLFFTPDPANGVFTPVGLFFQRVNRNAVEFTGLEAYFEGSFALGDKGSLTPYLSLGWLEGENLNPTQAELDLIGQFYNRSDTPIRLEGSVGDAPFGNAVPFQGTFALRYTSPRGKWFTEYEYRFADEINRVRPESVATGNITQFGILKSLEGYDKHTLRGGYEFETVKLTLGIENFTDELYFLPFQLAPAPGRSLVLGINYRWGRDL